MSWLQGVASLLADREKGLAWRLPTGFVAVQEYPKEKEHRIVTAERTLVIYEPMVGVKLDRRKQQNGIAPNYIHSLDAAHMMLTLNRLVAEGLRHFAMVHDSYGTHACDVDLLHRILREEFVGIYEAPVLARFAEEQQTDNPHITISDPPGYGSLDISCVLDSKYFFA